jgi:hypothetical protein
LSIISNEVAVVSTDDAIPCHDLAGLFPNDRRWQYVYIR